MHPGQLARATSLFRLLGRGSERRSRTVSLPYVPAARTQPLGRECAINLHGLAIASDGAVRRPFEMLLVSRFHAECCRALHLVGFTRKSSLRRSAGRSNDRWGAFLT